MGSVRIPLGNNKGYTLIDEEDYPLISQYKWHVFSQKRTSYARTSLPIDGKWKNIRLHRMLLNAPSTRDVDHINGDGLDNRRSNLRFATRLQNNHNQRKRNGCTNTLKGASFDKDRGQWRARIRLNGKTIFLGRFDTEEQAGRAYDRKAVEVFGEFAHINFTFQGTLL